MGRGAYHIGVTTAEEDILAAKLENRAFRFGVKARLPPITCVTGGSGPIGQFHSCLEETHAQISMGYARRIERQYGNEREGRGGASAEVI